MDIKSISLKQRFPDLHEIVKDLGNKITDIISLDRSLLRQELLGLVSAKLHADIVDLYKSNTQSPHFLRLNAGLGLDANMCLFAIATIIGTPMEYPGEGPIIMDMKPQRKAHSEVASYNNSLEMNLHTDLTYFGSPPDALGFYCVSPALKAVNSHFLYLPPYVKQMPYEVIRHLEQTSYRFWDAPHARRSEKEPRLSDPRSIVEVDNTLSTISVRYRKEFIDQKSLTRDQAISINRFSENFRSSSFSFVHGKNDVLVFSNKMYLHGRDNFEPNFSDNDRHIKRIYISY